MRIESMNQPSSSSVNWIRSGVAAGIATCLVYPALVFLHLPRLGLVLAAAFGPLLVLPAWALGGFLSLRGPPWQHESGSHSTSRAAPWSRPCC